MLAYAVHRPPRPAPVTHLRWFVDDGTAIARGDHSPRHCLRNKERRALVESGDRVVVLLGYLQERCGTVRSGVIDQNVEWRLGSDDRSNHRKIGHIQHDCFCTAALAPDLSG